MATRGLDSCALVFIIHCSIVLPELVLQVVLLRDSFFCFSFSTYIVGSADWIWIDSKTAYPSKPGSFQSELMRLETRVFWHDVRGDRIDTHRTRVVLTGKARTNKNRPRSRWDPYFGASPFSLLRRFSARSCSLIRLRLRRLQCLLLPPCEITDGQI